MRIAVTAETDAGLDSPVAGHFGHAPYFVLVDIDEQQARTATVIPNPYLEGHQPGQIPQFIHTQGADAILSGGMGGRAIGFFAELGIAASTGASGTVDEAVDRFLEGGSAIAAPCADSEAHGHAHG